MAVYQTYTNMMNEKIRKQIKENNPFHFKHISNLKGMRNFDDIGPCVMVFSHLSSLIFFNVIIIRWLLQGCYRVDFRENY